MQKIKNKLFSILMISLILPVMMLFGGCDEKTAFVYFEAESNQNVVYTSLNEYAGCYHIYVFDKDTQAPDIYDYANAAYYHQACEQKSFIKIHFSWNYGENTKGGIDGIVCKAVDDYYMGVEIKTTSLAYNQNKDIYLNGEKLTPKARGVDKNILELFYDNFGLKAGQINAIEYK